MAQAGGAEGVIDCENGIGSVCRIVSSCRLKGIFAKAQRAFLAVLDEYTLADLVENKEMQKALMKALSPG